VEEDTADMHPQRHRGRPGGRVTALAAQAVLRLRRAGRRAHLAIQRYEDELQRDPVRRDRSAMIVVGAAAAVVVLAMVAFFVVASQSHPPPARAVVITGPTPSATPSPTATAASPTAPETTASPTPTVPAGGTLRALHSGRCLAVRRDSQQDGARLVQRSCDGSPGQGFHLVPVAGQPSTYQLVDELSGRCVDVSDSSTADGARVIQWGCTGEPNQAFTLREVPGLSGYVQLVAGHSGKCLDVADVSTEDGAAIQQWSCHPADVEATMRNQSWQLSAG
jgi:hypothetical protein